MRFVAVFKKKINFVCKYRDSLRYLVITLRQSFSQFIFKNYFMLCVIKIKNISLCVLDYQTKIFIFITFALHYRKKIFYLLKFYVLFEIPFYSNL